MTYDEHSLIHWLESQALEAHNKANVPPRTKGSTESERHGYYMQEQAYNKTLAYLRNTRAPQLHRKLMEK